MLELLNQSRYLIQKNRDELVRKRFKISPLRKNLFTVMRLFFKITQMLSVAPEYKKNRILIINLNKIGDNILTFPALKEIVDNFGNDVFILVYKNTEVLYESFFYKDNIISIDKDKFVNKMRFASAKGRNIIKEIAPEIVIDFTSNVISVSLLFTYKAKKVLGTKTDYYNNLFGKEYLLYNNIFHLQDRYNEVSAKLLKKPLSKTYYEYPINEERVKRILIHPLAGWKAKEWSIKNYIELAGKLIRDYEVAFIFEKGKIDNQTLQLFEENKISYIETVTLEQLIDEIKRCSLFIGNDSGPMHIASIYGKPTFTIFGPTNPDYIQPIGNYHRFVNETVECSPVTELYCLTNAGRSGCPAFICMENLGLEKVYGEIMKLLNDLNKTLVKNK